ncbi:MAG: deoxyhypusine synthase family protein [Candidatus Hermodarchaeota archaeon]
MENPRKEEYLTKKISPFDINKIKNTDDVLKSLKDCGFQGKNLGIAGDILYEMFKDETCLTILTLSGAMIPAGMGKLISALADYKLVDVIISTGANITHDLIDALLNGGHYQGNTEVNDEDLFKHRINRIYDVFLPEDNYDRAEAELLTILVELFPEKKLNLPPSEFLWYLGSKIKQKCILSSASKNNIPIFIPAISDSELALNLLKFKETQGFEIEFRVLEDIKIFGEIIKNAESCGTFIVGGGVPRNWAQQIYPYIENIERISGKNIESGYKYSVRIHTAVELDGGLSGCTISESKSWGKYTIDSKYVSVWCDATIALPLLLTGVFERLELIS